MILTILESIVLRTDELPVANGAFLIVNTNKLILYFDKSIFGLVKSLRSTDPLINDSVSPNVNESSNSTTSSLSLNVIFIRGVYLSIF